VGGNKADWIRDMFHSLARENFPKLRALVLFDQPAAHTESGLPVDWSLDEAPEIYQRLAQQAGLLAPFTQRMERR
jgi:hypothetical protein